MASNTITQVDPVGEKLKLYSAVGLLLAAMAAAVFLDKQGPAIHYGVFVLCLIAAAPLFFMTMAGQRLFHFGKESWREVQKVVWPTRNDALITTASVFGFALVMAVFLFGTDKALEWLLYDLILGWNKHVV